MSNKTMSKHNKLVEEIYNRYKDPLYNFVMRLCNNQHLAQDVVQHTFLKALTEPNLAGIEHPKAWLFTIAHNRLKDEWKRKATVPFEGEEMMQDSVDYSASSHVGDNAKVTPEEESATDSSNTAVEKTIRQMPENFREVMLLRYTADLSVAEIAEITRRSVTDIKVSLHRARLKFETLHTASMYSKVAVSRNRCEKVRGLLQPVGNDELTDNQLNSINKHISKCNVCAKDAEELKRSRQLFVTLPLIPCPVAFDEFAKHLPQLSSATATESLTESGSSASQPVAQTTASHGSIAQTAGQTFGAKIAAGVAAAAIIAGTGFYLSGTGNPSTANTAAPEQNIAKTPDPQNNKPVNTKIDKNDGTITLAAKLSRNSQQALDRVKWKIEPLDQNRPDKSAGTITGKTGTNVSFTLPSGQYTVIATLDGLTRTKTVTIEAGKSATQPVVFEAGVIRVAMSPDQDISVDDVNWQLYSEATSSKAVATASGNFNRYLAAGKYRLHASYQGRLKKQQAITVMAGQTATVTTAGFSYGKLKLQATLGQSGKILDKDEQARWSIDSLIDGKPGERNIVSTGSAQSALLLAPGSYRVNLALGKYISKSTDVIILEGKTTASDGLVLEAGKLSLQATIATDDPLLPAHVNWQIDKLSAGKKTPFAKASTRDVARFYLPPGQYQVTASYGTNMNIVETVNLASGDTLLKNGFGFNPGAISFTAQSAGSNRLISTPVNWSLEKQTDKSRNTFTQISQIESKRAIFTLQPGHYRIQAEHGKKGKQIKEFDITPGIISTEIVTLNEEPEPGKWEWK